MVTRRRLLGMGAACAGAAALGRFGSVVHAAAEAAPAERIKGSLAFQLYCLGGTADPKTFAAGVAKIAELGFKGVELGPKHRRYCDGAIKGKRRGNPADPKEIGKIIRDAGLVITSSHMFPATEMMGEKLKANVEWHQAVGNKVMIVSDTSRYLGKSVKSAWLDYARKLTEAAEVLRPLGMQTGYHSHGIDFTPVTDGPEIPWDLVFSNTPKDVVMEIDYDNVRKHHDKVLKAIRDYAGRAQRMHFKRAASVWDSWGKDESFTAQHKALFDLYETVGRCEWYIIEDWGHQRKDADPDWNALKGHVEFFRKLGKL